MRRRIATMLAVVILFSAAQTALAIPGGGTTVKVSPWMTSSDSDLKGLSVRVWMTRIPNTTCDFQVLGDFKWADWAPRFWAGTAQTPDFFGITVAGSPTFIRVANTQSQVGTWKRRSNGATSSGNLVQEEPGGSAFVWSFKERDSASYMSSGQIRFNIRKPAPCSGYTMTVNAMYVSNDAIDGGPFSISFGALGLGLGFNVGGTSTNGRLWAEFTYP